MFAEHDNVRAGSEKATAQSNLTKKIMDYFKDKSYATDVDAFEQIFDCDNAAYSSRRGFFWDTLKQMIADDRLERCGSVRKGRYTANNLPVVEEKIRIKDNRRSK